MRGTLSPDAVPVSVVSLEDALPYLIEALLDGAAVEIHEQGIVLGRHWDSVRQRRWRVSRIYKVRFES